MSDIPHLWQYKVQVQGVCRPAAFNLAIQCCTVTETECAVATLKKTGMTSSDGAIRRATEQKMMLVLHLL